MDVPHVKQFFIVLYRESMNCCNKELKMRLTQLEQAYQQQTSSTEQSGDKNIVDACKKDMSFQEFDPLWRPFNELLEMANDVWRYYHNLYPCITI